MQLGMLLLASPQLGQGPSPVDQPWVETAEIDQDLQDEIDDTEEYVSHEIACDLAADSLCELAFASPRILCPRVEGQIWQSRGPPA